MNNNVVTPFLPILGLLSGVKPHLKCLYSCIGHSLFGEHYKAGYDTVFLALALTDKLMSILLPIVVLPLLG